MENRFNTEPDEIFEFCLKETEEGIKETCTPTYANAGWGMDKGVYDRKTITTNGLRSVSGIIIAKHLREAEEMFRIWARSHSIYLCWEVEQRKQRWLMENKKQEQESLD
jgi:hypothetical protein